MLHLVSIPVMREAQNRVKELARKARFVYEQAIAVRKWRKLAKASEVRLELGSGPKRGADGWTTVDVRSADIAHDLKRGIPLPENSVHSIYSSHFLEHLPYQQILAHLAECRRVLAPGGQILIAVPNARLFVDAYISQSEVRGFPGFDPLYNYETGSSIDILNYIAYMGGLHKFMFDEENLVQILKKVGFANAGPRSFIRGLDLEVRDYGTIYASGNK